MKFEKLKADVKAQFGRKPNGKLYVQKIKFKVDYDYHFYNFYLYIDDLGVANDDPVILAIKAIIVGVVNNQVKVNKP